MALCRDLMDMEEEFRSMNQELESKTEELLKRADIIVKNQEESVMDLVTPLPSTRESNRSCGDKSLDSINKYCRFSDNSFAKVSEANSSDDDSSQRGSTTNKLPVEQLVEKQTKVRERIFSKKFLNEDDSNLRECFEVMRSLSNFERENLEDDSDSDDDVRGMMKVLEDQKKYNKSVVSLMNTRESVRNRKDVQPDQNSVNPGHESGNMLDLARKNRSEMIFKKDYGLSTEEPSSLAQTGKADDIIVKALKFKIKTLQDELQKAKDHMKKKTSECDMTAKTNQGLVEGKLKLLAQVNSLKNQSLKLEAKIAGLSSKLQVKETECKSLVVERDELERALKAANLSGAGVGARLSRSAQEMASLKEQLVAAKLLEKELREEGQRRIEQLTRALGRSEKSARAAARALRGQAQLADNLRRQVALLAAGREVRTIEGQLDRLLSWET